MPVAMPVAGRKRRAPGRLPPAGPASVAALSLALLAGCVSAPAPCTGAATLEKALAGLGGRAWDRLTQADVVPSWPVPLSLDETAAAFSRQGAAVPWALWARVEREDREGCVCCQALELGATGERPPSLRAVSIRLLAPSWAEASRIAARLLLAGLPPHVPVELSLPPGAPAPAALPWEAHAPWTSIPDPDGRFLAGTAHLSIDRAPGGFVVFVRHERPGP